VNKLGVISTEDGSSSLINLDLNETYHSIHGAIQESRHVFIEKGLKHWNSHSQKKEISILEIGFGTGLNALLTLLETKNNDLKIYYEGIEAFPLQMETIAQLNYPESLKSEESKIIFNQLHQADCNTTQLVTPHFQLHKRSIKIQEGELEKEKFDLIYFDAFAPNKQPEMWELIILEKIVEAMKPQAVFVTYCAKGQLKRDLVSLGLSVEKISGPPGKREMIRAIKKSRQEQ
jgi:tRNA U34 5-methylaminomethyl-2-thiouridine-forming methyltransferase MnmC